MQRCKKVAEVAASSKLLFLSRVLTVHRGVGDGVDAVEDDETWSKLSAQSAFAINWPQLSVYLSYIRLRQKQWNTYRQRKRGTWSCLQLRHEVSVSQTVFQPRGSRVPGSRQLTDRGRPLLSEERHGD